MPPADATPDTAPEPGPAPLAPPASLAEAAAVLGLQFDPGDVEQLGRFLALLLDENTRHNLTAVTDPDEAWTRHVLDSLSLVPHVVSAGARRVADVGAGGGLPGIPLAIVLPDVRVTLVEATGKKARFLERAARVLGLDNVEVVAERVETAGRDRERHRERYDVVTARAVGRLAVLLELAVPLARVGGHVLAIKGARAAEEIAEAADALRILHAEVADTVRTQTGTIVVVEKHARTGKAWPRRPGEPKRAPLGGGGR